MKTLFLSLALAFVSVLSFGQAKLDAPVKFDLSEHSFGKIPQGTPVNYDFYFTNNSKVPVVIQDVITSCGCTTPVKPEKPIMPGKKDKITVGYNAAAMGPFEKTIYIKLEGQDAPVEIKITGEVVEKTL